MGVIVKTGKCTGCNKPLTNNSAEIDNEMWSICGGCNDQYCYYCLKECPSCGCNNNYVMPDEKNYR